MEKYYSLIYCCVSSFVDSVGMKLKVVNLPVGVVKYCKQPLGGLKENKNKMI